MRSSAKYLMIYTMLVVVLVLTVVDLAAARPSADDEQYRIVDVEVAENQGDENPLEQAELDQLLAPIALYPDSVLSHVLVAATYPLEVVQAARWREQNDELSEEEALEAVEDQDWDPSVKALVPFADLLSRLSDDLDWLQRLGDAFLLDEEAVLASIQTLRVRAYEEGNLTDNEYIEVVEENDNIIIEPAQQNIVYVPYYDTRVVYGDWWWTSHPPIYWSRPAHYYWYAGLYFSPRIYVRPSYFYGGFHWHNRHLVVHRVSHHRHHRFSDRIKRVHVREYQRWQHDPVHRRGVRYHHGTEKSVYRFNKRRDVNSLHPQPRARANERVVVKNASRTSTTNRRTIADTRVTTPRKVSRTAEQVNKRLQAQRIDRQRTDKQVVTRDRATRPSLNGDKQRQDKSRTVNRQPTNLREPKTRQVASDTSRRIASPRRDAGKVQARLKSQSVSPSRDRATAPSVNDSKQRIVKTDRSIRPAVTPREVQRRQIRPDTKSTLNSTRETYQRPVTTQRSKTYSPQNRQPAKQLRSNRTTSTSRPAVRSHSRSSGQGSRAKSSQRRKQHK